MLAKGVIRKIVQWKDCRSFFFWRLKRRLAEQRVVRSLKESSPELTDADALAAVHAKLPSEALDDDRQVVSFLDAA